MNVPAPLRANVAVLLACLPMWGLIAPAGAQAVDRELTIHAAVAIARDANPGLQAEKNDLLVSDAAVRAARRDAILPTLNTSTTMSYSAPGQRRSGSVLLTEQPSIYSSSYGLNLNYQLSAARFAQPGAARAERQATQARLASSVGQLEHDVAVRYLAAMEAEDAVAQAERELARANDYLKLARIREALGVVSLLEVTRSEVQAVQGEVKVAKAKSDVRSERASLSRLLGVRLGGETRLTSRFAIVEPRWDADSLIAQALRRSMGLEAKRGAAVAAAARARIARLGYLPTVSMSMSMTGWAQRTGSLDAAVAQRIGGSGDTALASRTRDQVRDDFRGFPFNYARQPLGASITVSYPILPGWSRESQLAQSRAAAVDAELAIRSEEWRIATDVENTVRTVESAFQTARLQATVREKAGDELRLTLDRARFGAVGGLAVVDAQSQLGQAELAEVQAIYAFHRALLDLELLVGLPLSALRER